MGYWLVKDAQDNPLDLISGDAEQPAGTIYVEENGPEVAYIENMYIERGRIEAIKKEANARIINQLPGGEPSNYLMKENNIQARVSYLMRKETKGTISTEETTELDEAESLWVRIEDIRTLSDLAETNGDTIEMLLTAYDAKGY